MSTRLEALIEQTDFLLEKQKEAQADTEKMFDGLLGEVENKLKNTGLADQDMKSLNSIRTMVQEHLENVAEQMQEDIDFLTEQLAALKHVGSVKDEAKSKELLNMMIDESEELLDTEEFKENVNQESVASRQTLDSILDDMTNALKEGKFQDVELFLEALCSEEVEAELDEEEEGEDSGCGCCESKCGSKKECGSGVNIFKGCSDDECDDDCCK